jgi:hypothetical protein
MPSREEHLAEAERIEQEELPQLKQELDAATVAFYDADRRRSAALDAHKKAVARLSDARQGAKAQARP